MKSIWITNAYPRHGGLKVEHTLLAFTDRTPVNIQDTHLAMKLGELDPFVTATEACEDVVPEQVQWMLSQEIEPWVLDWAEAEEKALGR